MIRFFVVALAIVPATLWYGLKVIWNAYRGTPPGADVYDLAPRNWSRLILRLSGVTVRLEGVEVIDPERPQILVANHASWYDVLVLAGFLPGRWVFVAKRELQRVPVFGRAATACGQIFIDRRDHSSAVESLAIAKKRLEEDRPTIIMFPEGTRSATGALGKFKKGAFVLAIQAGVDIVPAAIVGSWDVMRKRSLLIRSGTIVVRFGEPIAIGDLGLEDRNHLTERVQGEVAALLGPG